MFVGEALGLWPVLEEAEGVWGLRRSTKLNACHSHRSGLSAALPVARTSGVEKRARKTSKGGGETDDCEPVVVTWRTVRWRIGNT